MPWIVLLMLLDHPLLPATLPARPGDPSRLCTGFGMLSAAAVACAVLACFQSGIDGNVYYLDYVWVRCCLNCGVDFN